MASVSAVVCDTITELDSIVDLFQISMNVPAIHVEVMGIVGMAWTAIRATVTAASREPSVRKVSLTLDVMNLNET